MTEPTVKMHGRTLSSYLAIKGLFVEETFRAFSAWNLELSVDENIASIRRTNVVGASSTSWLDHILRSIKQRFDLGGQDRSLVMLVKHGWPIDHWQPVLLWHACRSDELLRKFLAEWLFEARERGIVLISSDGVVEFLRQLTQERLGSESAWKETTYLRVANGLLKIATDFHLMRGRVSKEFEAYHLPLRSFMYLLHSLMQREQSTRNLIDAADWRIFLLKPNEVEEELLRLHQYGELRFERAGSFLELTLPFNSTEQYIRSAAG